MALAGCMTMNDGPFARELARLDTELEARGRPVPVGGSNAIEDPPEIRRQVVGAFLAAEAAARARG